MGMMMKRQKEEMILNTHQINRSKIEINMKKLEPEKIKNKQKQMKSIAKPRAIKSPKNLIIRKRKTIRIIKKSMIQKRGVNNER
jgi:hypothetical protein